MRSGVIEAGSEQAPCPQLRSSVVQDGSVTGAGAWQPWGRREWGLSANQPRSRRRWREGGWCLHRRATRSMRMNVGGLEPATRGSAEDPDRRAVVRGGRTQPPHSTGNRRGGLVLVSAAVQQCSAAPGTAVWGPEPFVRRAGRRETPCRTGAGRPAGCGPWRTRPRRFREARGGGCGSICRSRPAARTALVAREPSHPVGGVALRLTRHDAPNTPQTPQPPAALAGRPRPLRQPGCWRLPSRPPAGNLGAVASPAGAVSRLRSVGSRALDWTATARAAATDEPLPRMNSPARPGFPQPPRAALPFAAAPAGVCALAPAGLA